MIEKVFSPDISAAIRDPPSSVWADFTHGDVKPP